MINQEDLKWIIAVFFIILFIVKIACIAEDREK